MSHASYDHSMGFGSNLYNLAQHAVVQGPTMWSVVHSAPVVQSLTVGFGVALFTFGLQQLDRRTLARLFWAENRIRDLEKLACPHRPVGGGACSTCPGSGPPAPDGGAHTRGA